MLRIGGYVFKRADTVEEFDQIHALNYRTFVSELAQYSQVDGGRLVDKFHHKNIYFIALSGGNVVGMVSVHGQPPFSIADRLADPTILDRPGMRALEVRLLAVDQDKRGTVVLAGLVYTLWLYAQENGITHLFISGVQERLSLYQQLGFEAVGPAVPSGQAVFVPMVCEVAGIKGKKQRLFELWLRRLQKRNEGLFPESDLPGSARVGDEGASEKPAWEVVPTPTSRRPENVVCLLPGPVTIAREVHDAFHRPPIYHRGQDFLDLFEQVRGRLARMTGARYAAILNGSGTLANEAVAATLAAEPRQTHGLLLVNGEFGQRLARQATRFELSFDRLEWNWGEPWDLDVVERRLMESPHHIDWVWGVHQESSTGVLNDLQGLITVARRFDCKVCIDCISSLGATPLDLSEVYLASGATGKALGSYAGAALIFSDPQNLDHLDLTHTPSYLDVPAALRCVGPRFTFPSSTLYALDAALAGFATEEQAQACYDRYHRLGQFVRTQLRHLAMPPLAAEHCAAPVITTFAPPSGETSESFVARCHLWGYAIGGASGYLQERRLVQIATMGAIQQDDFAGLFDHMREYLTGQSLCHVSRATPCGIAEAR